MKKSNPPPNLNEDALRQGVQMAKKKNSAKWWAGHDQL